MTCRLTPLSDGATLVGFRDAAAEAPGPAGAVPVAAGTPPAPAKGSAA